MSYQKVLPLVYRSRSSFAVAQGLLAFVGGNHRHGRRVVSLARVAAIPLWLNAQQIPIEMLTESTADAIQGHGVGAGVDVAEAEADDAKGMPVDIVNVMEVRVEVEH